VEGESQDERRLRTLFDQHATRVFAYAARHSDPGTAQDIVSEVFLVAWRRIADVPEDALPWLLVSARNVLHNHQRSMSRRQRLAEAVAGAERLAASIPAAEETAVRRDEMLSALAGLTAVEREAVLLVAWDGLSTKDAATVAGCSGRAFEVRLSRARSRLERILGAPPEVPDSLNEVLA
jgi:RNA polymerase sigma-70 factor (ECF subfamily)